jgi:GT2 family glycosyltransferase
VKPQDPEISFVIVSWNAKRFLRECLVSLLVTTRRLHSEVLVVDNASTDGSWEMVLAEFPEVTLLRNETNTGFALANNRGIAACSGQYICLVNSDVQVLPEAIEALLAYMEDHPEVGLLGPKVLNSDRTLQPSCRTLPTLRSSLYRALALDTMFPRSRHFGWHFMTWMDYGDIKEVDILSGCFWLIRRAALTQVGGLDTQFFMYGEDIDFCRRFRAANWRVVFNPNARIIHHGGASSANAPVKYAVEMQRAYLQYFLKHDGRCKAALHLLLAALHHWIRFVSGGVLCLLLPAWRQKLSQKVSKNGACARWLSSGGCLRGLFTNQLDHDKSELRLKP